MKLYIASSWRNEHYPRVVEEFRAAGFTVLDWRNPGPGSRGFSWSEIDPAWQGWSTAELQRSMLHPYAIRGFRSDYSQMQEANACVCLLPCGRSAHLEAGWFCGKEKPVYFLRLPGVEVEPELMMLLGDGLMASVADTVNALNGIKANGAFNV